MPDPNEWTIMFYFAGDNPLSPLVVSQIKSIKDAGYQKDTDVLIYFDSYRRAAPARLYHVNRYRKEDADPPSYIGDHNDPYVRNFIEDIVDPNDIKASLSLVDSKENRTWTRKMEDALRRPKVISASDALNNFIGYCRENHSANHYMLFLVGHGMIVGSDTFLPDESTATAITLEQLEKAIAEFGPAANEYGALDLLALHSCSMSAIEVAYQLKGKAKYMLASEGLSYVGSWPYRQLLKKLFNNAELPEPVPGENGEDKRLPVSKLIRKMYYLAMYSATDFMLSGYSLDLCLSRLSPESFYVDLKDEIIKLVRELKKALDDPRGNELIVAAHLESQSYWGEQYSDLYDFCDCLALSCGPQQKDLAAACTTVTQLLTDSRRASSNERIVLCSENFGSQYQYSRGMSIYFPWYRPAADFTNEEVREQVSSKPRNPLALNRYIDYRFNSEMGADSWFSFLDLYWTKTMRGFRRSRVRTATATLSQNGGPGKAISEAASVTVPMEMELGSYEEKVVKHSSSAHGDEVGAMSKELEFHEVELGGPGEIAGGAEVGAMNKELGSHEKETGGHSDPNKELAGHGQDFANSMVKNFPSVETTVFDARKKRRTIMISGGLDRTFKDDSVRRSSNGTRR